MMKWLTSEPIRQSAGLGLVRVIMGGLLLYHGAELFNPAIVQKYLSWDVFKTPGGKLLVYTGKIMELLAGILFVLGCFTRVACLLTTGVMGFIIFFIGKGRIWYEEQHPFLFILLAMVFFFTGPGSWSLDKIIFDKRRNQ